jgi:hypothetical protein
MPFVYDDEQDKKAVERVEHDILGRHQISADFEFITLNLSCPNPST